MKVASCLVLLALTAGAGCEMFHPEEDADYGPRDLTSADGVRIDYEVAGSGRPVLVFVPGWCCDRSIWATTFERFAHSNRVVAIDLGRSGVGSGLRMEWSIDALAADVADVLEKEDLHQVLLVGHSLGAAVCLEAATRAPNRVTGVIGIEALHDVERSEKARVLSFVANLESNFAGTVTARVPQSFGPKADPAEVQRITKLMASNDPSIAIALERSYAEFDFAGALERQTVPLRLINSRATNVAADKRHAKDFGLVSMSGVGYFPMIEDKESFAGVFVTVLEELRIKERLGPGGAVPERTGPSQPPKHE